MCMCLARTHILNKFSVYTNQDFDQPLYIIGLSRENAGENAAQLAPKIIILQI